MPGLLLHHTVTCNFFALTCAHTHTQLARAWSKITDALRWSLSLDEIWDFLLHLNFKYWWDCSSIARTEPLSLESTTAIASMPFEVLHILNLRCCTCVCFGKSCVCPFSIPSVPWRQPMAPFQDLLNTPRHALVGNIKSWTSIYTAPYRWAIYRILQQSPIAVTHGGQKKKKNQNKTKHVALSIRAENSEN